MRLRLLALPVAALALTALSACSSPAEPGATQSAGSTASANADGCAYETAAGGVKPAKAPDAEPKLTGEVPAVMQTSVGDFQLTLDADRTPCTVNSFASLAEQGYYDDTVCHRLVTEGIFVLQCGDPSATGQGGPGYSYADELDGTETYPAGTLAMANAGPDTNGSQFFIVYQDTQLSPDYTVFGHVDEAAVQAVADVAKAGNAADGVAPATEVKITGVTVG